jgi:hypothetical protein
MTTVTLDEIKAEQSKLAEMIARLEVQTKLAANFPITINTPQLNNGERWLGAVVSADGKKCEHIILLPGEKNATNWKDAMAWAASIGGELPDRTESALLFATMKDEFKPEWYWSCEEHAAGPVYAWLQVFDDGIQNDFHKSDRGTARAVRRLKIFQNGAQD